MLFYFDGIFIILALLILMSVLLFLRYKKNKNSQFLFCVFLFVSYLFMVFDQTQCPIFINEEMLSGFTFHDLFMGYTNFIPFVSLVKYDFATILSKIMLFVPFGMLIPLIKKKASGVRIIAYSCVLTVSIELMQLLIFFISKNTSQYIDINIILFGVIGSLLGYALYLVFSKVLKQLTEKEYINENKFLSYIITGNAGLSH